MERVAEKKFIVQMVVIVFTCLLGVGIGYWIKPTINDSSFMVLDPYLNEVNSKIEQYYYGDLPSGEARLKGAAAGLVSSLDDQYTYLIAADQANEYFNDLGSQYVGIGVQLGFDGENTYVQSVFDGFPASGAGLASGDTFVKVNDEQVLGLLPEPISNMVRGQEGTEVTIQVIRSGELLDFKIKRQSIDLENITFYEKEGIVVIDIFKFTENSNGDVNGAQEFNELWDEIVNQIKGLEPNGLILDLRNNPGGYVSGVQYIAEEFLSNGQIIMQEKNKQGVSSVVKDFRKGVFEDIPIVVLVNSGSASAAEILAAAIQENNRGMIIGVESVGKGVEQSLVRLNDGSVLLVVSKAWLTPSGRQINSAEPIQPDLLIENKGSDDLQLEAAITQLKKQ